MGAPRPVSLTAHVWAAARAGLGRRPQRVRVCHPHALCDGCGVGTADTGTLAVLENVVGALLDDRTCGDGEANRIDAGKVGATNPAHPGLLVDGLWQLPDRLEQAGHLVTRDGEFPGYDRFYSADPVSSRLEFLQVHPD